MTLSSVSVKKGTALLSITIFCWTVLTSVIQGQILGVVFLALVLWSLYPDRHLVSSIIIIVLLAYFQASISIEDFIASLLSTYGGSGLWIIISGFILAKGMETSGLAQRIALWIVSSLGGNPENIVLSVAIANIAVAPLSPSTTAKAFLLLPICTALIESFDVERGASSFGTAIMLMAMAANNICSTAFLTATVPNPISAGYIQDYSGLNIGWLGWLRMALPLTLLLLGISWIICVSFFKPEVIANDESLNRINNLMLNMGYLSRSEKIVSVLFALALLLWITDGLHGYNAGIVSLGLSLLLFLPKIGVIKVGGFAGDVPWGSISLFAASMYLAKAVSKWRALDPLASFVFNTLNLSDLHPLVFVSLVVLISMFLHVVFTSTTVYATVMVPLVISLAQLQVIEPILIALPIAYLTPIAVILPVNTIPNIVFHSSGYFNQKQIIVYGTIISAVSVLVVLLIGLPYWRFIGFL